MPGAKCAKSREGARGGDDPCSIEGGAAKRAGAVLAVHEPSGIKLGTNATGFKYFSFNEINSVTVLFLHYPFIRGSGSARNHPLSVAPLFHLARHLVLVSGFGLGPQGSEIILQGRNSTPVEAVEPPRPIGQVSDQARFLQHLQMLGNRRPADRQASRQAANGLGTATEPLEDREPGRIGRASCRERVSTIV